jgi:hypothetical protein
MKKQLLFWVLICVGFFVQEAKAQLSVGLAGTYTRYFAGGADFPIRNTSNLPHIMGGKLNFSTGFLEFNALRFGVGYNIGISDLRSVSNTTAELMHGVNGKVNSFELSIDYQRYFVGSYNYDYGIYGIGGLSYVHNMLSYTIPDADALAATGEAKFYKDKTVQLITLNAGLGGEVWVMNKFYWFLEATAAVHVNAYINDTTIKQSNLMYFFRGMTGFRVPFGAAAKSARPKRKRF